MYDFSYSKAASVADAVKALGDAEAKVIAGGQTFIPVLKQRLNKPSKVVDLAGLKDLVGIRREGDRFVIGAMTTHHAVATNADIRAALPGLSHMASHIGDTQVRHRGTMGGSLANNDPSACYPSAVLALKGTIVTDRRRIAADDYFQGMFTTALEPDEIITAIELPVAEKTAYMKFPNPASRYAMVGVFVARGKDGVRVTVTGAGQNGVFRHTAAEEALAKSFTPDAVANVTISADGLNSDIHASAEYRAHLIGVMTKRAVAAAG